MHVEIIEDIFFHCPLVERDMCEGECYDVQMVRSHFIKEELLVFVLDRTNADRLCEHCPFNQLSGQQHILENTDEKILLIKN